MNTFIYFTLSVFCISGFPNYKHCHLLFLQFLVSLLLLIVLENQVNSKLVFLKAQSPSTMPVSRPNPKKSSLRKPSRSPIPTDRLALPATQAFPQGTVSPTGRPAVPPQQSFAYGSAGRLATSSRLRADVPVTQVTTAIESGIANARKHQPSQLSGQPQIQEAAESDLKRSSPVHHVQQRRVSDLQPVSIDVQPPEPDKPHPKRVPNATTKSRPQSKQGEAPLEDYGIEHDIGRVSDIARIRTPPPPNHRNDEGLFIPRKDQTQPSTIPQNSNQQRPIRLPWEYLRKALWLGFLTALALITGYYFLGPVHTEYGPSYSKSAQNITPGVDYSTPIEYNIITNRLDLLEDRYKSLQSGAANPIPYRKINYFSTGLGAVIDPHLTSPTKRAPRSLRTWLITRWYSVPLRESLPPAEALGPWDDIGDCWCTPPTPSGGKAQLAVILPRKIVPTQLVVEHIPRDATLDIGAAPRGIELWIPIVDRDKRQAVASASLQKFGEDEESIRLSHKKASKSLDYTWVRIGTWRYNIFSSENVQTFNIDFRLEDFRVAVNKVAVRVHSNWGTRDYVCLYRLKLFGLLAEEDPMYMDTAPVEEL